MKTKIFKDKKGASGQTLFFGFVALAVLGLLGYMVLGPTASIQQTALQVPASERSLAVNTGQIASVKMKAVDQRSATLAQESAPAYVWNAKSPNVLLNDATVLSSTTTSTVNSVSVGDEVCATGFNGSFYGDVVCKTISQQSDLITIPVHKISTSALMEWYYKSSIGSANTGANSLNMSLGANQADSFSKFRIQNNKSNARLNLKSLVVDTASRSNLSQVVVSGMEQNTALPQRLVATDQANFRFDLPQALALNEFEDFVTGSVTLKADGDGCITPVGGEGANAGDIVILRWVDESQYKAVKGTNAGSIVKGVEDDANSPADVGRTDLTVQFYCTA